MNILHISTADNSGGAAKAAYRLVQGLRRSGARCTMLVKYKSEVEDVGVDVIGGEETLWKKMLSRGIKQLETMTGLQYLLEPWGAQFLRHPFLREADVVHFHNIHSDFVPLRLVHKIAEKKPIVWTCHDMWPMTGHCTYPDLYGCEKFVQGCSRCPHLEDYPKINIDTTSLLFSIKEKEYALPHIKKMIAPSRWMESQLRRSRIFSGHDISCIPYGVDTKIFHPMDRTSLRAEYKIDPDEKVLMFSALDLAYERKGGRYVLDALKHLLETEKYPKKLVLLAIGHRGSFPLDLRGLRVLSVGLIEKDSLMSRYYNLADIYVHAALADNLPNAVLESLACGTPVAAFAVGGVPDMVRSGITGELAQPKNAVDLARAIKNLLDYESIASPLASSCRSIAKTEYSLDIQTARLMAVYKEVM